MGLPHICGSPVFWVTILINYTRNSAKNAAVIGADNLKASFSVR